MNEPRWLEDGYHSALRDMLGLEKVYQHDDRYIILKTAEMPADPGELAETIKRRSVSLITLDFGFDVSCGPSDISVAYYIGLTPMIDQHLALWTDEDKTQLAFVPKAGGIGHHIVAGDGLRIGNVGDELRPGLARAREMYRRNALIHALKAKIRAGMPARAA